MPTFKTTLLNSRAKAVEVRDSDGTILVTLDPNAGFVLETEDATATFAPFVEVVFVNGPPWARPMLRPDFPLPNYKWPCVFTLVGGKYPYEYVTLHDRPLCLMRGVPVRIGLSLLDDQILFERVEVGKAVLKRQPSSEFDGVVEAYWGFEDVTFSRPLADVKAIQAEIEALAAKVEERQ